MTDLVCVRCGREGHRSSSCPRGVPGATINGQQLTVVETRTVELLAAGLSNRRIAEMSCCSTASIDGRLKGLSRKLGTSGRVQLAVMACKAGLV